MYDAITFTKINIGHFTEQGLEIKGEKELALVNTASPHIAGTFLKTKK